MSRSVAVFVISTCTLIAAGKPHNTVTGKVVAIADGDTLTVLDGAKHSGKFVRFV
jgi:hypothetical protein